jgi:tetratricopeptide (TPR) repeat protein
MALVREEARKRFGELRAEGLMKLAFPRAERTVGNLGYIHVARGQHDKALAEGLNALERNPISAGRYAFLIACYTLLNRLEEARAFLEEAKRKNIDSPSLHFCSYKLAFLGRDQAGMENEVVWGMGKPAVEDVMLSLQASTHAFFGRLREAREFSGRAVSSAELLGKKELARRYQADAALREAFFGNSAEARLLAESLLSLSTNRNIKYKVALALAFAGDVVDSKLSVDNFDASLLEDTVVRFSYLPTLNARLALNRNDPSKAIEALEAAIPYELGSVGKTALYPIFVRGEAFLRSHQGKEAATEFQKILDHPGISLNGAVGVRGRLGLAQAYIQTGDTPKAKLAYEDFLTLWKDADAGIPILSQAKAEYARLQ